MTALSFHVIFSSKRVKKCRFSVKADSNFLFFTVQAATMPEKLDENTLFLFIFLHFLQDTQYSILDNVVIHLDKQKFSRYNKI